jgi:ferredoxin-thioredoxin reductase catalytic chain
MVGIGMMVALASGCGGFVPTTTSLAFPRLPQIQQQQQQQQQQQHTYLQRRPAVSWQRVGADIRAAAIPEDDDPEHEEKVHKALKAMVGFSNSYVKNTDTRYCSDASIPAVVIKGLAEHKVVLGAPLCPCRHYEDKEAEAKDGYWNCPCVPMRERHECHCMLFLTKDNEFAGDSQKITIEETVQYTSGMSIL